MKRVILILILIAGLGITAASFGPSVPHTDVKLYFTDAQILKLIPVRKAIPELSSEEQAKLVLRMLIEGDDDNLKIRRTIPHIRGCMSVRVENKTAYVNIKKSMAENHAEGRDIELLTVYSIVNSLTSIKDISTVKFTVNGKIQKDFMGYLDMRETFIPDYAV